MQYPYRFKYECTASTANYFEIQQRIETSLWPETNGSPLMHDDYLLCFEMIRLKLILFLSIRFDFLYIWNFNSKTTSLKLTDCDDNLFSDRSQNANILRATSSILWSVHRKQHSFALYRSRSKLALSSNQHAKHECSCLPPQQVINDSMPNMVNARFKRSH